MIKRHYRQETAINIQSKLEKEMVIKKNKNKGILFIKAKLTELKQECKTNRLKSQIRQHICTYS